MAKSKEQKRSEVAFRNQSALTQYMDERKSYFSVDVASPYIRAIYESSSRISINEAWIEYENFHNLFSKTVFHFSSITVVCDDGSRLIEFIRDPSRPCLYEIVRTDVVNKQTRSAALLFEFNDLINCIREFQLRKGK